MTALIGAVLVASLLGSVHCAGMCGAFLAVAVAGDEGPGRAKLNAAYNLGRLVTYSVLGGLAGLCGAAIDLGGSAAGIQRTAAMVAGAMMLMIGTVAVLRHMGFKSGRMPVPRLLHRLALKGHRVAAALPPLHRAAAIGLLTTLLPCGWLYAFVITAAGTGHPGWGAATMAVFWTGTLPVMIGLGVGLQTLTGRLRRHLPIATSLLIVAVGLWTMVGRLPLIGVRMGDGESKSASIERVRTMKAGENCPLCK